MIRLRCLDLWMANGRREPELFKDAMHRGHELYRLVKDTAALRVIEIRPNPTYSGTFLAGALPETGKLITVAMNGKDEDPETYIPKPLRKRWTIRRVLVGDAMDDVPDGSADVVIIDGPVGHKWDEEAWRVLRVGGVVSVNGKVWTVHTKGEVPGI